MSEHILLGGPSILLVEDHPFQLIGMEMLLNRLGFFRLTPALDCTEALAIIKSGSRYDLLLCDQHLPDGRGIELIDKAYKLGGISHAMIISGIEDPPKLQQLLWAAQVQDLPLLACLSKPLPPKLFLRALEPLWPGNAAEQMRAPWLGEEHGAVGDIVCTVEPVDGAPTFADKCRRGAPVMREMAAERCSRRLKTQK